jgi:hypothetical protein
MNARTIQLEDSRDTVHGGENIDNNSIDDHNNNNDRLEVILYSNAATNAIAGELVEVEGRIYVQKKVENGSKGKKLVNILHGDKIIYKNREKIVITSKDIQNIQRWKIFVMMHTKENYKRLKNIKMNPGAKK